MRGVLIVLALFWAVPAAAEEVMAFEEEPALFVTVQPEAVFSGGAYVQGEIVVTILVTSLYPFESLNVSVPNFDAGEVVTLLKPRMRRAKTYSGTGYLLEQAIAIYPDKSGKLVIPAVRATGHVEPKKDEPLHFDEESPEIVLDISGIQPAFKGAWWMVSPNVSIAETWSKPVDELREGDVVRREITLTASGVPHTRMQLPEHGRTRGIAFTQAGTSGHTEVSADGAIGTLTRAWDLKIGVGSTLYIAPMGVDYWHPGEGVGKKASVRGYRIEPLPPDEAAIAAGLMEEAEARHGGARRLALAAAGLAALPFLVLAVAWTSALVPTRADRRLAVVAAGAPPEQVHRAVVVWAGETGVSMQDLRHDETPVLGALLALLFAGSQTPVEGRHVARELTGLGRRRRLRRIGESLRLVVGHLLGRPARLGEEA